MMTSPSGQDAATVRAAFGADFEGEVLARIEQIRIGQEAKRRIAAEDAAGLVMPRAVRLDTMLASPPGNEEWIVENLLRQGTLILVTAERKAGKTTLVLNLARSLLDGVPFLGTYQTARAQGYVVLFDFELPYRTAWRWLNAMSITNTTGLLYEGMRGRASTFNVIAPGTRAALAEQMLSAGVKIVIIDCLTPLILAHGLDENTEAGRLIEGLQALQAEAELDAVVVVHHQGWGEAERARGDSKLEGLPDDLWRLSLQDRNDPGSLREFYAYGRHADAGRCVLNYQSHQHILSADHDAPVRARGGRPPRSPLDFATEVQAVTNWLRATWDTGPFPGQQAVWARAQAENRGFHRDPVREARRRLNEAGAGQE
jgi:AAA domain